MKRTATTHLWRPCRSAVLACLATAPFLVAAEARPMHFGHITLKDGLSQSTVTSIHQDSQSFMWFGTENGLNRYDGYTVKRYLRNRKDVLALHSAFIWEIAEDSQDNLWLATEGGGVARWNRHTDDFEVFLHDPDRPDSVSSNLVRSLAVGDDDMVWVATRDNGLDQLNPATGRVQHFRHDPASDNSLSSNAIYAVYVDGNGDVWVGTDRGLNWLHNQTGTITQYKHSPADPGSLSSDRVVTITEDHKGYIWVGTSDGGVNRLDRSSSRFTRYGNDASDPFSLSDNNVRAIYEDSEWRLWVGTANGLNLLDRRTGGFSRYFANQTGRDSLSDNYVMSIAQDQGGILWVGTRAGGVNKWNPRSWKLGHYHPQWMESSNVTSFADDHQGNVWIGTLGAGLARVNLETLQTSQYLLGEGSAPGLSDDRVMSLLLDSQGSLWVGTMAGGLNRLQTRTGSWRVYRHDPANPASLGADGIMTLFEDRAGDVWVGTFGGGVSRFSRNTGRFTRYGHHPDDSGSLGNPRATAITQANNGMIWVGTDGGGINVIDPSSGKIRQFRHDPADPDSLSSDHIFSLHRDDRGRIWIGTAGDGLVLVQNAKGKLEKVGFKNISRIRGKVGTSIYGVQSDESGDIWLTTNNGLARYSPEADKVRVFLGSHGAQGEEFNYGAHHRAVDGQLYFGGARGFNAFYPGELDTSGLAPQVVLTAFEKLNSPVKSDTPYNLLQAVELDHEDDVVTFQFAALDYAAPLANSYAHRLEGFDRDWVYTGNRRRVTYTNLSAGDYVLKVRAANSDGVWNDLGLRLPVRVNSAPWETVWAYSLYTMIFIGLVYFVWRRQQTKLRQKAEYNRRLEVQVRERTKQLKEQNQQLQELSRSKSDFLANMSHEIRTPMNGVLGMTELLLETRLDKTQQRFSRTIYNSAASLLEIINDILDFSKIEAGKLQLENIEFDLRQLIEETAELLAGRAYEKGLELMCETPSDLGVKLTGDPFRLRQILVNLIGNAVKFTDEGEIVVICDIAEDLADEVTIRFEVSDTGIGISEDNRDRIFESFAQADGSTTRRFGGTGLGLAISRQLAEMMGGELGVTSRPSQGSKFWFTVQLSRTVDEAASLPSTRSLRNLRVLVVDGNRNGREILERQLKAWKMDPVCTGDGEQAIKMMADAADGGTGAFNVVILDSCIPDIQTGQLIAAVRAHKDLTGLKIILLRAMGPAVEDPTSDALDADAVVSKPMRQSDLYEAIVSLVGSEFTNSNPTGELAPVARTRAQALDGRVLLVEDNPVNQVVANGMLTQLGCQVTVTDNGQEAVYQLSRGSFDLVLMDCEMPVMDGFEATAAIRQQESGGSRVPIVALTANALEGDRERCLEAGMNDYLSKPFTARSLRQVLERWLKSSLDGKPVITNNGAHTAADEVLIDESALQTIRDLGGDQGDAMVSRVIDLFLTSADECQAALAQGFETGDALAVRQAAHALKSSSANLGAFGLSELCGEIETCARQGSLDDAGEADRKFRNLYPRVISALQASVGQTCT